MHRRSFFSKLIGAAAVGTVATSGGLASSAKPLYPTIEQPTRYRTYDYHWTGLKAHQERQWVVGQWIAWPSTQHRDHPPPYLYLNVPGFIGGVYHPGYVFNIVDRGRFISGDTSEEQIRAWICEGREYLVQLMDANYRRPNTVASTLFEFPFYDSKRDHHAAV